MSSSQPLFDRVAIIGIGLIGSSLALAMRQNGLVGMLVCGDAKEQHVKMALELELVDEAMTDNVAAARDADLVILSTPVGALGPVAQQIGPHLKKGCIVMDVGSVKGAAIAAIAPHIPAGVHFVPAHPIAGTEESGPEAGFAELFHERWCLLTPLAEKVARGSAPARMQQDGVEIAGTELRATEQEVLEKITTLWKKCGAKVELMEPAQHDRVLAMVSHFPHCVAFTSVATADDLAGDMGKEVIQFAGSSFRDLTRVAASDPVMWRDIFLTNRDAVLDILQRFKKDLAALEQEIEKSDGPALLERFERGRAIRRGVTRRLVEPPKLKEDVKE